MKLLIFTLMSFSIAFADEPKQASESKPKRNLAEENKYVRQLAGSLSDGVYRVIDPDTKVVCYIQTLTAMNTRSSSISCVK